jgi:hypothetical protein
MRKLTTTLASVAMATMVQAQAILPTTWNFDDPTPTGWTESLDLVANGTRYTNGFVGAACKLDADDEYVVVNFSDVCGGVSYYIKGQGSASNDVFTVQESINGTNWTTLRTFNQAELDAVSSTFVQYTDVPSANSRYIRWYFTDKQSGRNVALDEIALTTQVPTNAQEIGVSGPDGGIPNNGTLVVGNQPSVDVSIENVNLAGGAALNISDIQITGPNASDFSYQGITVPGSVGAAASSTFQVNFSTVGTGTRLATMTISNNDANGDETTFTISLIGIGGNFATEPTASATNLAFSNVASYGYDVTFAAANPAAERYLVTRSIGMPATAMPADGQTYVKGDYIDNNTQVVHVGAAGTFRPTYNVAGTTYHFAVYSVNGPSGYENYLTSGAVTGNVTTSGNMMGSYYQGINPNATSFLTDLQTRLGQNYDQVFYGNYAPVVIDNFASRDTTDGQRVVTCVYSGFQHIFEGAFFYDVISREHSWPHSWMPVYPDDQGLEYSDLHNLFPAHQDNANAVRSNRPLGNVVSATSSFLDAQYGDNAEGQRVYEPRDQHKGDAARAIFYMAVKWNGTGGTWELPNPIDFAVQYGQDQDVLKQWHWQDPPDAWEIARNDFVQSQQGNRNPFVDSVNWVCYIDFENLTYIGEQSTPCTVTPNSIREELAGEFLLSPNPTDGFVGLTMNLQTSQDLNIELMDISGRIIDTQKIHAGVGIGKRYYQLNELSAGVYQFVVSGTNGRKVMKLILN